jgi:hypothetical protein
MFANQLVALSLTGFSIAITIGNVVAMFALIATLLAITFVFMVYFGNN